MSFERLSKLLSNETGFSLIGPVVSEQSLLKVKIKIEKIFLNGAISLKIIIIDEKHEYTLLLFFKNLLFYKKIWQHPKKKYRYFGD